MATENIDHAQSGGMPQLDFSTWASQIFWTAVALFVLYKILNGSILPKISGALEDRHNAIADDLDKAAELKRQAEDAEAAHTAALATAKADANKIVAEAQSEIDAEFATASAEADAEIAARTAESEVRINEVRAEAQSNAKSIATDTAQAIIEKLAPGLSDKSTVEAAVSRALSATGGTK